MRGFTNSRLIQQASQSLFSGSGLYVLGWVISGVALMCVMWLLLPSQAVRELFDTHEELSLMALLGVACFLMFLFAAIIMTIRRTGSISLHDTLTQLPNRYWLKTNLPRILQQGGALDQSVALLFINFDNFKHVNDRLGHSYGDRLLEAAARRLVNIVPETAIAVRIGGDEFLVVQQNANMQATDMLAADIVLGFGQPFQLGKHSVQSGASIGISLYPHDGMKADDLIKNASVALYSAKQNKGCASYFDATKYDSWRKALTFEASLLTAIQRDQFVLHYQPRIDTKSGRVVGLEALVRWQHPELGLVFPNEFIPVAEQSELIVALGSLVLRKAIEQQAQWAGTGVSMVPVSVNVSAKQFNRGVVWSVVRDALDANDVAPQLIDIELTESAVVDTQKNAIQELDTLRAMGIKLHVDDFGTGHSSLAMLQQLNLDVLKIDRAFVMRLSDSPDSHVFIRAIISMAHALNMTVIAEGVETDAQWQILSKLGCDEVQGYLFSKPIPAAQVPGALTQTFTQTQV